MNATRRFVVSAFVAVVILSFGYVRADFTFGKPVNLGPILGGDEVVECLSYDGLEMYIVAYDRPGGQGDWDLWVVKRDAVDRPWGPPENLGPTVNTADADDAPSISVDGLTLYFHSYNRPGGYGNNDIYRVTRATRDDSWGEAVLVEVPINRTGPNALDAEPWISPDGLEFYFVSHRSGSQADIYVASRPTTSDPWGEPANLGPGVNSTYFDVFPSLSPDGLLLLFCDSPWGNPPRPGGYGNEDTWMTRRATLSDPWQAPVNLGPRINSPGREAVPRISPDGRTLHFWSNRGGSSPNWRAPVIPIVDFNGDGKVDGKEDLALAEHWGQDDPSYDIGPFPWGDGIVDANDLKVLAEYMGKEVEDPMLVAHWALDETEGAVAKDSAGGHEATLMGNPVWQPAGGKVGGALAFDGLNDFGFATVTLNPPGQTLSVLAWVQGGAPGEVVIAEQSGKNWLYADAAGGCLATALNSAGQTGAMLSSATAIADGQWHRIAVVWDGTYRMLYVDEKEVARDALPALELSSVRLVLGGGSNLAPATFWSGLIDDVRIYNRGVRP